MQRRKRQNCGSSTQGHHSTVAAAEGTSNHFFEPIFAHRAINQGNRLNTRAPQFNASEAGNRTYARYAFNEGVGIEPSWNAVSTSSTLPHRASNSVGNNSYPYVGDGGRISHRRKSNMQRAPSGTMESNPLMFTQGYQTSSYIPICNESRVSSDGQEAYQSLRNNFMPANRYDDLSTSLTQDSYYSSIVQNDRAILPPRRSLTSETINNSVGNMGTGLFETLAFREGNGSSAIDAWGTNNTFLEEGNSLSGVNETNRNSNYFLGESHRRQAGASEVLNISPISGMLLQPPNRAHQPAHFIEFTPQASHIINHPAPSPYAYVDTVNIQFPSLSAAQPLSRYDNIHTQRSSTVFRPPGSAATFSGPQATLSLVNMPGQFLPRYDDTSRASNLRQVSLRRSRALPPDSHQFPAFHWLPYEWADALDEFSDMRLDVDNMSYEELLALEEWIGNVNTGVSEDSQQKCLKMSTYSRSNTTTGVDSQERDSICSICQEKYVEGDELGELQCGHGYHTDCIKQWLLLKNECPICKAAAR